jgi:hypothetical protein
MTHHTGNVHGHVRHNPDNKTGVLMCVTLLDVGNLTDWEREFMSSILSQIEHHPVKYRLSPRQYASLMRIWHTRGGWRRQPKKGQEIAS